MPTQEIQRGEWTTFFDTFSKMHPGDTATVQVLDPDLGVSEEARSLPFVGISADRKGSEKDAIWILLGTEAEDHLEHMVPEPTHVWLKSGDTSKGDALEIEAEDGTKTIVQLEHTPRLKP